MITKHDPATDFVRSHVDPGEYAKLLQQELRTLPSHIPPAKRVPLAHLIVLEKVIKDPVEQARARARRKTAEQRATGNIILL